MEMSTGSPAVVIGIDFGGTKPNATVLGVDGRFLVDRMVEVDSRVLDGPAAAVTAIEDALDRALATTATDRGSVLAVGLDTPGPASAEGVISVRGATNFSGSRGPNAAPVARREPELTHPAAAGTFGPARDVEASSMIFS